MTVPVVITGASGRLGRRVAELLLAADGSLPVVLVTRTPSAVAHLAAATVRRGDFDDDASLASAFAGADGGVLLLVSTDALGRRVDQHRRAIEAAVAAGISHVVYTSLSNPVPGNPVQVVTDAHRRTEEALVSLAPRWTILRNATYADALLPLWRAAALDGRLVTSQGSGRTAWIARDDCAAVAAAVLSDDGGRLHAGQVYDVTGPALMGAAELASALAAWSGRPVSVEAVDDEAMVAHLVTGPPALPDERARLVVTWHRAVREGWFVQHTDAVERLTGHPARSVADLLAAG